MGRPLRNHGVGHRWLDVLSKTLLPALAIAVVSTASASAEAADNWKIKRQVWSDIAVDDSQVHNGMFKTSIDFVGGKIPTNYGSRLAPVCRTSDGRIASAVPYKSGSTWHMKCLGQTYSQGARALSLKSRYTYESDTITRARGRLPQATVKITVGGGLKALCLGKVGDQEVPGIMDIPSVTSTAELPDCKVWIMGSLTPVSSWTVVKHVVTIPSYPNTWWSPGNGDELPELPTYVSKTGTFPMCRSHEVFGAKWPGTMSKTNGPEGSSVYCNYSYLDGAGVLKAGKTKNFEIYLASDPSRPAFPGWGSAQAGASADYGNGLQISPYSGSYVYLCLQTYGKLGFSTPSSKKCRAANGSAARENNFKLMER